MRRPLMSGFCAHPTDEGSHKRCHGGNTANPDNEYQPCPCRCHLIDTEYECGGCGRTIKEAPLLGEDEDGDAIYVHVAVEDGRMIGEDCG